MLELILKTIKAVGYKVSTQKSVAFLFFNNLQRKFKNPHGPVE
jgi:hypothetical protein